MICTWEILEGEYWWGGCADEGTLQPYGKETSLSFDYSGNAYLDKIDVSPPNFAGKPIVFSKITQTTVNVSFTSNDVLDKIEYSLNNQKTWIEINSKSFQIKGLSPNSSYTIYIKIRKKSNQKTTLNIPPFLKISSGKGWKYYIYCYDKNDVEITHFSILSGVITIGHVQYYVEEETTGKLIEYLDEVIKEAK